MIAALTSTRPCVWLRSGLRLRVQFTKVAFMPLKSWSIAPPLDRASIVLPQSAPASGLLSMVDRAQPVATPHPNDLVPTLPHERLDSDVEAERSRGISAAAGQRRWISKNRV